MSRKLSAEDAQDAATNLPLSGFRIVDLTAVVSGPMATQVLADQGADVIKIEPLPGGELTRLLGTRRGEVISLFETINKGKRSMGLDLKQEQGKALLARLIGTADVLVENFRPGALERLGFGADRLRGLKPDLVYVSITGFGPDGPYAGQRVYDAIVQAVSGMAAVQGNPDTGIPELVRNLVCDKVTALTAAQAITAALLRRVQTGKGARVELSMLDAAVAFLFPDGFGNEMFLPDSEFGPAEETPRTDTYKPYLTTDGAVTLMIVSDKDWSGTCRAVRRVDLIDDPRFLDVRTRRQNPMEIREHMEKAIAGFTTADLMRRMEAEEAPCAPVNSRAGVLEDPQVVHNRTVSELDHPRGGRMVVARAPAVFDGVPQETPGISPGFAEHTAEVLEELGLGAGQIAALRAAGVVPQE